MILVLGATGNVGRSAVELLVERGEQVRAMTRDPDTARLPEGVEVVRGDPSDGTGLGEALVGVDGVLLIIPGRAEAVASALDEMTPRRVVLVSSLTAGSRPELAYADRLRETEAAIRSVAPHATVLRPGQFATNALWWKPMVASGTITAPFVDVPIPVIDPLDIAAVAAEALTNGGHEGATYTLSGPEAISTRQQVEQVDTVLGVDLQLVELSEDEFRNADPDAPAGFVEYFVAVKNHPTPEERVVSAAVSEITGRAPKTFADWVRRNRLAFQTD